MKFQKFSLFLFLLVLSIFKIGANFDIINKFNNNFDKKTLILFMPIIITSLYIKEKYFDLNYTFKSKLTFKNYLSSLKDPKIFIPLIISNLCFSYGINNF